MYQYTSMGVPVLQGQAYAGRSDTDTVTGSNTYQSPQAPPPLPSSYSSPVKPLPAVGGGLQLTGWPYGY